MNTDQTMAQKNGAVKLANPMGLLSFLTSWVHFFMRNNTEGILSFIKNDHERRGDTRRK
jgi:hypothetical protein